MANLISQVFNMLQRTKYNNMEPDAVDFFGECMNSPQNGRTPLANEIYVSYKINGYMHVLHSSKCLVQHCCMALLLSGFILCSNKWLQRRKESQKKEKNKSLPPRLLLTVSARSAVHPPSFLTLVSLDHRRLAGPHRQPHKYACKLSLRKHSKHKERKLLGSRKSCKHSFKLNGPHLKKTKVCCVKPKRK